MNKQPYTTKTGAKQFKPIATDREVSEGSRGFCLACGRSAHGIEPDARKYTCPSCEAPKVYGLEELLMMGLLILKESRA